MFRSLFARLITTFLTIYLAAVLLLGGLSMQLVSQQVETQTLSTMKDVAHEVSSLYAWWRYGDIAPTVYIERAQDLADQHDASIWVIDSFWRVLAFNPRQADTTINSSTLSDAQNDFIVNVINSGRETADKGVFDDQFGEGMYTVGVPSRASAVFVHMSQQAVNAAIITLVQRIAWGALAVFALGAALMLFMSRHMTRPLREMLLVVQAVGQGQFDRRVRVRGRDEVAQLAGEFNKMASDLQSLEDLRRDFVANVSHELKSPLTSIQGYVQGMLDGTIEGEERQRYMGVVVDETRRLNKLISELLDLSRLESGQFPLHETDFDVNELIRRSLLAFEGRIEARDMSVQITFKQDVCPVHADGARIEQVLRNLFDNAIKYGKQGGTLSVWTHAAEDRAFITVKDDGPGIDPADLPYIFERFYKADKAHSGKGTGLGLSIVKRILTQHGTDIEVQSRVGEGTSFLFSLPRAGERGAGRAEAGEA